MNVHKRARLGGLLGVGIGQESGLVSDLQWTAAVGEDDEALTG